MGATTVHGRVDLPEIIILSLAKGWGGAEEYLELLTQELTVQGIAYRIVVRKGGEYANRFPGRSDIVSIDYTIKGLRRFSREHLGGKRRFFIHANRYYDIFRGWYLKRKNPGSALALYQHCFLHHPNRIPLGLPDGIICISEYVKSSITRKYPGVEEKTAIIPTAIDTRLFRARKPSYETDGPVKVGMVGRFDKNQEELVSIAADLRKRGVELTVHFAGKGHPREEEKLRKVTQDAGMGEHVTFHGHIPHPSMPEFYAGMDLMVSTMKIEGLSLVAMEAMACGVPFVAYNRAGFRELIDSGENGVLVDGGTGEFASAIEELSRSLDMRKAIGSKAAEKAERSFGIEKNVDRYVAFVGQLLQGQ